LLANVNRARKDGDMAEPVFHLVADVSSADPAAVEQVLRELVRGGITQIAGGFHLEATMTGASARELNRTLLSALRRAERRTRLRAEWTADGVTERFFDYAAKGSRPAQPVSGPERPA
jgi:hypothetical protein